jgi:predicted  nucleic acid-binding Zn-ribbon protein
MEIQKVNNELESNIKVLTERLTKYQEHLNTNIIAVIKRLREEKKLVLSNIATINGAIQAYQGCQQMVKPDAELPLQDGA